MDYEKYTREELIEMIKNLRGKIDELEMQKRLDSIDQLQLELIWTTNLGRWDWIVPTGQVIYNYKKIEALGYKPGEINPDVYEFTQMIHPDDYEATMENMRLHLEGRTPLYEVEYRIRTKDGNYKWFYDKGKVTKRDEQGNPLRVTGIVFDITEKKEAELKVKRYQESLEQFKEGALNLINNEAKPRLNKIFSSMEYLNENCNNITNEKIIEITNDVKNTINEILEYCKELSSSL